jgi:hypothetical protein
VGRPIRVRVPGRPPGSEWGCCRNGRQAEVSQASQMCRSWSLVRRLKRTWRPKSFTSVPPPDERRSIGVEIHDRLLGAASMKVGD